MAHTPGPWTAEASAPPDGVECFFILGNKGQQIADVHGPQWAEQTSNAILMAASPDLLSALGAIIAKLDDDPERFPIQDDPGCLECTASTTPNDRNTGPCAYHKAKALLKKLEAPVWQVLAESGLDVWPEVA